MMILSETAIKELLEAFEHIENNRSLSVNDLTEGDTYQTLEYLKNMSVWIHAGERLLNDLVEGKVNTQSQQVIERTDMRIGLKRCHACGEETEILLSVEYNLAALTNKFFARLLERSQWSG